MSKAEAAEKAAIEVKVGLAGLERQCNKVRAVLLLLLLLCGCVCGGGGLGVGVGVGVGECGYVCVCMFVCVCVFAEVHSAQRSLAHLSSALPP